MFGSVVAFTSYVWLLANAPISFVATYAYVNPVVAVFLGWLVLGEHVTWAVVAGGGIVVSAVALVISAERPRRRTRVPVAVDRSRPRWPASPDRSTRSARTTRALTHADAGPASAAGYRGAMSDRLVSDSTTIDAPPAVVFAIVSDPRQHPRIDGSGSLQGVITGPERLSAKGDTFGMDMKLFGLPYKIRNKVVEFEADRRIAWRHFGAHRWRYELEPVGDGATRVTETWDATRYSAPVFAALRGLGFPARNQAGITETLVRLKKAAEEDLAATP